MVRQVGAYGFERRCSLWLCSIQPQGYSVPGEKVHNKMMKINGLTLQQPFLEQVGLCETTHSRQDVGWLEKKRKLLRQWNHSLHQLRDTLARRAVSLLHQGEGRTSEDVEGDKPPPASDQDLKSIWIFQELPPAGFNDVSAFLGWPKTISFIHCFVFWQFWAG